MRAILTLAGKTTKGKQRVQAHGPEWTVLTTVNKIQCSSQRGPWFCAMSTDTGHITWVHKKKDERYEILNIEEIPEEGDE